MASPPRISRALIEEALTVRGGNVSAAAEDLGLQRSGMYDRMKAFGIDPRKYREQDVTFSGNGVTVVGSLDTVQHVQSAPAVAASRAVQWREGGKGHKFGAIMRQVGEAVGAAVAGAVDDIGAEMVRRAQTPPRLTKAHLELVHSFRRQLNAARDTDYNASDILNDYIAWGFERYAAEQLAKKCRLVSLDQVFQQPSKEGGEDR